MGALYLALLPLSIAYANGVSLSAVDIEGIQTAAAEFAKGPLSRIDAKADCDLTADEEDCSAQAAITVETASGPQLLTVSKIDGLWKIGRWQREIIAFQKCAAAAKSKEDRKVCYGPTGKYGGVRKK